MSNHNYTPTEALETLLRKLRERDESLAMAVRLAIDSGKDIPEEQQIGRKKVRRYRKTIPFTHEEALNLSLGVLKAYFVELPLCINSAVENFKSAGAGAPRQKNFPWSQSEEASISGEHVGADKSVEIELQTATQILRSQQQTMTLKIWERSLIDQQMDNLNTIRGLFDFTEE